MRFVRRAAELLSLRKLKAPPMIRFKSALVDLGRALLLELPDTPNQFLNHGRFKISRRPGGAVHRHAVSLDSREPGGLASPPRGRNHGCDRRAVSDSKHSDCDDSRRI